MYYILHKDNKLVGVSNTEESTQLGLEGVSIETKEGDIPDLNKCVFDIDTNSLIMTTHKFTKLEFLSRFTMTERINIQLSQDPIVIDIMKLFEAAEFISTEDMNTRDGIGYFATIGLITPERMGEILNA